jgi:hypothetical protein
MSDRVWEELAEPAFDAAIWVLKRLYDVLMKIHLEESGLTEDSEFASAADGVVNLERTLVAIKAHCYRRRIGD